MKHGHRLREEFKISIKTNTQVETEDKEHKAMVIRKQTLVYQVSYTTKTSRR